MKSGLFDFDAHPSFWIETEKDFGRNGANDGETASPRERHRTHISSKYARKAMDLEAVFKALNFEAHGLCESESALSVSHNKLFSVRGTIQNVPLHLIITNPSSYGSHQPETLAASKRIDDISEY